MKKLFIFLLAFAMCLSFCSCNGAKLNNMFNAFEKENTADVAFVRYNVLEFGGKKLDFNKLLKSNSIDGTFKDAFFIKDGNVWFCYTNSQRNENDEQMWNIANVSLDNSEMNVLYSGDFCAQEGADKAYIQQNVCDSVFNGYPTDSGLYYDGKIVLTDKVKVVEFDIETLKSQEFSASEYQYPVANVTAQIVDYQNIKFTKDGVQKSFDTAQGTKTSEAFKKMYELEKEKIWSDKSPLCCLFDSIQAVEDNLYVMCCVLNCHGETHALAFEYDFETNGFKYVFNRFMGDIIGSELYIVPVI